MHGVRDRLSVRRALRAAHRTDPRHDRATPSTISRRAQLQAAVVFRAAVSGSLTGSGDSARSRRTASPLTGCDETPTDKASEHADAGPVSDAGKLEARNCAADAGNRGDTPAGGAAHRLRAAGV